MSGLSHAVSPRLEIITGDITSMDVDAIVNAANTTLLGGGGVDGAIHRTAGPELLAECKRLGGCATGDAKITGGYRLRARHVIHTVGPVWRGGAAGEDGLLASCYEKTLMLAAEHKLRSVAFPGISTGVYRFPAERAARMAQRVCREFLQGHTLPEKVFLVCYDEAAFDTQIRVATETGTS